MKNRVLVERPPEKQARVTNGHTYRQEVIETHRHTDEHITTNKTSVSVVSIIISEGQAAE